MHSAPAYTLPGSSGRVLRFAIGEHRPPELIFAAPDAPDWQLAASACVTHRDDRFALADDGVECLTGAATNDPYRLAIDVGDAEILGFGAATGASNRNGARFRIMTRDTLFYGIEGASYTAMPFFVARRGSRCIGVMAASTYPLDVAVTDGQVEIAASCATDGSPVDVMLFRGSLPAILRDLSTIVGRSFLPPAWALGFHQSRWSYRSADAVLNVARRFRQHALPADAIHLDIHYMDRFRVFTFDQRRFPSPEQLHAQLRALGFRTLAIIDPGVSTEKYGAYDVLQPGDMLLRRQDGRPYVGRVWPGAAVFPDFSREDVRRTWGRLHRPLVDAGVAGFWNDMNDPVLHMGKTYDPLLEDVYHHGAPHRRLRNLYANGMAEGTVSGLAAARPEVRPFVLSRSGFLGIQRHAAVWTGDNHSTWDHLRANLHMVLNLGLSGVPITGADVGGFGRGPGIFGAIKPRRPSAELFVRWMELGALMPFFRIHSTLYAPGQEPWRFGARTLDLARRILRRRYRLLPLLYRLALEAHEDGLPIVRPLFMHFDVPSGLGTDQFLLGENLLAAPVLERGATQREVWLPAGTWVDWNSGERLDGARTIVAPAPLGTTPLFVRAGAALFLAAPARNAEDTLRAPLALEVTAPPQDVMGHGSLFLDDGETASGRRFLLDVAVSHVPNGLSIALSIGSPGFRPQQRDLELRLPREYSGVVRDRSRLALTTRDLADEDRQRMVASVQLPMASGEVLVY